MTHQEGIKYRDVKEKERESERGENLKLNILLFSKFSAHLPKMTSLRMYSIKKKNISKKFKKKTSNSKDEKKSANFKFVTRNFFTKDILGQRFFFRMRRCRNFQIRMPTNLFWTRGLQLFSSKLYSLFPPV